MSTSDTIYDGDDFRVARKMRKNASRMMAQMRALDVESAEYAELLEEYSAECERERKVWRRIERRFRAKINSGKRAS